MTHPTGAQPGTSAENTGPDVDGVPATVLDMPAGAEVDPEGDLGEDANAPADEPEAADADERGRIPQTGQKA